MAKKKSKTKMPVNISELMKAASSLGEERDYPVYIDLVFDITARDPLINAVIEAFETEAPEAMVRHTVLERDIPELPMPADLCVIIGGQSLILGDVAAAARSTGTPTVVAIAEGETYFAETPQQVKAIVPAVYVPRKGVPVDDIVAIDLKDPAHAYDELGRWIVRNAPAKRVSMAACFPFLRRSLAEEVIRAAAARSAAIGVLVIIPGADMPAITLEQSKMVLQIASVYGQPLDMSRAAEIGAVVAGGFGFRAIARQLVELVPLAGIGIKGGIAYTGTLAMGRAVLEYYEGTGAVGDIAEAVSLGVDRLKEEIEALAATVQEEQGAATEEE